MASVIPRRPTPKVLLCAPPRPLYGVLFVMLKGPVVWDASGPPQTLRLRNKPGSYCGILLPGSPSLNPTPLQFGLVKHAQGEGFLPNCGCFLEFHHVPPHTATVDSSLIPFKNVYCPKKSKIIIQTMQVFHVFMWKIMNFVCKNTYNFENPF